MYDLHIGLHIDASGPPQLEIILDSQHPMGGETVQLGGNKNFGGSHGVFRAAAHLLKNMDGKLFQVFRCVHMQID